MCTDSLRGLEEERRLLYVAITRAERHCIMTYAQNRFRYGRMEYDTPSRFIRDIDPHLLQVEGDNSKTEKEYLSWGQRSDSRRSEWMQNPRPVATQFQADPMPRAVAPQRPAPPVDPFSDSFKRQLEAARGKRLTPINATLSSGRGTGGSPSQGAQVASSLPLEGQGKTLYEGATIEHQRFGIGTITRLEGTGENMKATVKFRNAGVKQLLMKFAKFRVVG